MSEIEKYDYHLPPDLIAQQPLARRSDARLMVVHRADRSIAHAHVRDLPEILSAGDALVVNNTRVVPARLVGVRTSTGGRWEGLFLEADAAGSWRILSKTRGKLRPGETVTLRDVVRGVDVELRMAVKNDDGTWIVRPVVDEPWLELLDRIGHVPIPPYIRGGEMLPSDRQTYQTTFAVRPGAVAAPTAGLHFTPELFAALAERGVSREMVTLHVGLGTFRPIAVENLSEHQMHREWGEITAATAAALNACRARGGRIVSIGTTSVRVLETAADEQRRLHAWSGETGIFIRPPYTFRAVDALLTNFHLPRSTLLVLVRTFGGDALMKRAYDEAIRERYRFYSYGDAMLIL
jgi:S-adenosylmethionine:tRNA ribosyltransferase-isomerase